MKTRFRKTLSFSDIQAFLESKEGYLDRITSGWQRGETLSDHIGETVHAVAAAPPEEREKVLAEQLQLAQVEDREQLEKIVRERVNNGEALAATEGLTNRRKEKLISYFDQESGWTFKAKPDEMAEIDDGFGGTTVQITELKNARFLKERHRQQLYFFAMVVSLAQGFSRPIKLIVRLLGSGTSQEFWYSPKLTEKKLGEVRSLIQRIEAFLTSVENRQELQAVAMNLNMKVNMNMNMNMNRAA